MTDPKSEKSKESVIWPEELQPHICSITRCWEWALVSTAMLIFIGSGALVTKAIGWW